MYTPTGQYSCHVCRKRHFLFVYHQKKEEASPKKKKREKKKGVGGGRPMSSTVLISFNVYGVPYKLLTRTRAMLDQVLALNPAVVCLQEVMSATAQQLIRERCHSKYHMIFSQYTRPVYPWFTYVPSLVFCILLDWYLLAFILYPLVLQFLLQLVLFQTIRPIDFMANVMLLRKDRYTTIDHSERHVFSTADRGYSKTSPFWWFQMSFLRPNFMLVVVRGQTPQYTAVVVNAHLVTGKNNPARQRQVQLIHAAVERVRLQFQCARVILCGDLNATPDSPELHWLCSHYSDIGGEEEDKHRIDYVLTAGYAAASRDTMTKCGHQQPRCSDHLGIVRIQYSCESSPDRGQYISQ